MSAGAIIFYAISACILGAGLLAVTSRMIFRSAIWLLASLAGIAALYIWMELNFIAAVQIIVYVGGIVVLIIFSIFLTQQSGKKMPSPLPRRQIFATLATVSGLVLAYRLISQHSFPSLAQKVFNVPVAEVGTQMLSTSEHGYVLPFEVVSILLLSAMIGCIVIALKSPATEKKLPGNGNGHVQPDKITPDIKKIQVTETIEKS
jgi:NADH-quinone oxidoreductase subunit J